MKEKQNIQSKLQMIFIVVQIYLKLLLEIKKVIKLMNLMEIILIIIILNFLLKFLLINYQKISI